MSHFAVQCPCDFLLYFNSKTFISTCTALSVEHYQNGRVAHVNQLTRSSHRDDDEMHRLCAVRVRIQCLRHLGPRIVQRVGRRVLHDQSAPSPRRQCHGPFDVGAIHARTQIPTVIRLHRCDQSHPTQHRALLTNVTRTNLRRSLTPQGNE